MKKTVIIFFGILLGLFLSEFLARLLPTPYSSFHSSFAGKVWIQCDAKIGWRGQADASATLNSEGYIHEFVRNSDGMHDTNKTIEKKSNVFRVMILGDSFVEAMQVAETETSHQILEDILNASGSSYQFEVISAGVSGWSPAQQLIYFQTEGNLYKPDLILVFWYPGNDLRDNLPGYRMVSQTDIHCYAPYFAICDNNFDRTPYYPAPGVPDSWAACSSYKKFLVRTLNYLYSYSRLYQQAEPILGQFNSLPPENWGQLSPYPWIESEFEAKNKLDYSYELTEEIFSNIAKTASEIQAKTAIVIVPFRDAVRYEVDENFQTAVTNAEGSSINPRLPYQQLTNLEKLARVPVLDLQPAFVTYVTTQENSPYWWGRYRDFHWNSLGNQIAAESVAEWLIDKNLVPIKKDKRLMKNTK